MTKLAIMSDLHIDLNHFDDFEIQTLIDTLSAEKNFSSAFRWRYF